jgi:hexulose-6-phosphate isomerase
MDDHMTHRIGIMQGRLSAPTSGRIQAFPEQHWADEFAVAKVIGLDTIEFIFDSVSLPITAHPLLEEGCASIRHAIDQSGVQVTTVCADYFMQAPLHDPLASKAEASVELMVRLLSNCGALGVTDIVLPCVDQSSLLDDPLASERLVKRLQQLLPLIRSAGVNIALETDLPPAAFIALLEEIGADEITVNYDVGNSAALGFNTTEEWAAYGSRVSTVHIKDRVLGGTTVPLGTGDVDFPSFFCALRAAGYGGLLVLQGARGDDDAATAKTYMGFVQAEIGRECEDSEESPPRG